MPKENTQKKPNGNDSGSCNRRIRRRRTRRALGDIGVYGQESNYSTSKLARMNLAISGFDANLIANSHDQNFDNLRRLLLQ